MEDITSKKGEAHVTSTQFRAIVESLAGVESYIASVGEELEPELSTNNTVIIRPGILIHHGHVIQVPPNTYDTVNYLNGSQGMKRIDLVVARYTRNTDTGNESTDWVVIQGEPDATAPVAPDYTMGNMQEGDLTDDCPVFELYFDGINVTSIKKVLKTFYPINNMINKIYPIGTIYMSVNSVNPGEVFGGVWKSWGTGRVPVGVDAAQTEFNAVEKTGGDKNLQAHSHDFSATTSSNGAHTHNLTGVDGATITSGVKNRVAAATGGSTFAVVQSGGAHTHTVSGTTGSCGSGNAQNLQPYITCYMWKRIA